MKKLLLVISLATLSAFSTHAQVAISKDFTYNVSKPYKVVDGSKAYFSKNDEIVTVKYGKGVFTLQKFSGPNMNEIKRTTVDKTEGFTTESYQEVNGKFYFFYSIWDKSNTKEQLFVREVDFENTKFVGPGKKIISVNGKITGGANIAGMMFGFGGSLASNKFEITKSFNEKNFIVKYRKYPESKNDKINKDVIGMYVFDYELNPIWDGEIKMPYTEKKMNNIAYSVDENGNAYILSEIINDESGRRTTKDGEPNYTIELIKIEPDQTMSNTKVTMKGKFTDNVDFFEGKNNEIVIAGFYSNSKGRGIDGFFMSKLVDESVEDIKFYEIPVDVMKMYLSDRTQNKLDKKDAKTDLKMFNMVLRNITYKEDGSMTIYGEKYYVTSYTDPKTGRTTYTYYYQEIIGAGIDKDGELLWMKKFPKNQIGSNGRGGMGYYLMTANNVDYLLFLDNVNNIQLPLNKFPKAHKDGSGGYLTGFKVDRETGETEKVSLFDTRDAKGIELFQFNTGRIIKVNEKTIAVECYKKKKEDVMVTIHLK